eukprot:GHVH01001211.1.p1 GENE.GHVH01001211.1~~GHVH01001211.1.p1  ORF type:complete len:440 (-),score=42.39 GHVH01001211.1:200-1519(-)
MGRILDRLLTVPQRLAAFSANGDAKVYFCVYCISVIFLFILGAVGDPEGDEVVDSMYRFFFTYIYRYLRRVLCFFFGDLGGELLDNVYHYIWNTNNCLIQISYLVLVGGINASTVYLRANQMIDEADFIGFAIILILPSMCFSFFTIVSIMDPGTIETAEDLILAEVYWKRDLKIHPIKICSTDSWVRPPRSRHCGRCGKCVMKHDHHCPWIGNCVGPMNYKFFHLFLWSNFIMCAAYSVWQALWFLDILNRRELWNATIITTDGHRYKASWLRLFEYLASSHVTLMMNLICALSFAIACGVLTLQSVIVVITNRTIAESSTFGQRFHRKDWPYYRGIIQNTMEVFTMSKAKLEAYAESVRSDMGNQKFTDLYITPMIDYINGNEDSSPRQGCTNDSTISSEEMEHDEMEHPADMKNNSKGGRKNKGGGKVSKCSMGKI